MLRLQRAGVLFTIMIYACSVASIFGGKLTSLCYGNLISDFPPVESFDVLLMSLGGRNTMAENVRNLFLG